MYLQRKELFLVKVGEPVGASCYCRYRKEQGGERSEESETWCDTLIRLPR